jgi:hypothetical protein
MTRRGFYPEVKANGLPKPKAKAEFIIHSLISVA